jgi:cell division protein FtsW (lipid II flippase)
VSLRNRELALLLPAVVLVTIGFTIVYLRESATLNWTSLSYGLIFLGLFGLVHVAIRIFVPRADPYLLPITALLSSLGILLIYRINADLARLQAEWFLVGLVVFVLVLALRGRFRALADYKYLIGLAGIGLLVLTVLLGRDINGARLWIRVGGVGFQPPEFAKLLLVIFFAAYLAEVREFLAVSTRRVLGVAIPPFKYLAPLFTLWGLSLLLMIFLKDLGTSLLFFAALLALMYVATGRPLYVVTGTVLFAAGATVLYRIFPHVRVRVDVWLNPWKDVAGKGYQVTQSLFALAAGGLFGRGLTQGYLVLDNGNTIIPALATDFIFSAIGEELGLAGAVGVVLLYFVFVYRGLRIAVRARDDFSRLLATGLTTIFGLQAFIIIGGVTKLIPLTGITLPFVSYGGSSIVANFALLALLLVTSDHAAGERDDEVRRLAAREAAGAVVSGPPAGPPMGAPPSLPAEPQAGLSAPAHTTTEATD